MTISINDLPYDLLYLIFTLCWGKSYTLQGPSFPTTASHVCRQWREHALNTPSFWAFLVFQDSRLNLEKYQTWLERSRDYPLDIVLGSDPFYRRSVKTAREILRLIVPCSNRWRSLIVFRPQISDKVIRVIFDRLLDIHMPMLTNFEVVAGNGWHPSMRAQTKWRFRPFLRGGAPKLRNMVIDRLPCDYIDARFTSLTVLDIFDLRFGYERASAVALQVHHILSRLPYLQILRLRCPGYYPRHLDSSHTQSLGSLITPPLSHGSLTEISIAVPAQVKNALLCSLVLPEVQYFLDRTRQPREKWEIALGICCLPVMETTHPFPNLISLRLGGNSKKFGSEDSEPNDPRSSSYLNHLRGALGSLLMLRSLTFSHVDWENNGYLGCLSRVCPNLEWLACVACSGYGLVELQSIVEIRRKLRGTDSLVRLAVHGTPEDWRAPLEQEAMSWLAEQVNLAFVFKPESIAQESERDYLTDVMNLA